MNEKLTFAAAMQRLDEITRELNSPNIPLEKAMDLFKEGLALSSQCEQKLQAFQNEMNQLIVKEEVR